MRSGTTMPDTPLSVHQVQRGLCAHFTYVVQRARVVSGVRLVALGGTWLDEDLCWNGDWSPTSGSPCLTLTGSPVPAAPLLPRSLPHLGKPGEGGVDPDIFARWPPFGSQVGGCPVGAHLGGPDPILGLFQSRRTKHCLLRTPPCSVLLPPC